MDMDTQGAIDSLSVSKHIEELGSKSFFR
jgi:hypothetical protein